MKISHVLLKNLVGQIFLKCGCREAEADRVAHCLVESNLVGHDSHGVIRVTDYVRYLREDRVRANQQIHIVQATDVLAVVDGQYGFGQVVGEQAINLGIEIARKHGLAAVSLRNSGHLGRIGDWPQQAAAAGMVSIHFVNTSGFGLLVAPFGGIDRRLSANPIAAGVPVEGRAPLILDISTCAIAEGKVKVARNRGEKVPLGCMIDSAGQATDDPQDFYANPPGALLPFGGHKGYGLSVMAEMFAGALTGNGCSNPARNQRLLNGMFSILVDPSRLSRDFPFEDEVGQFIKFVKSSRCSSPEGEILMPGEIEERTKAHRLVSGIDVDDATWKSITETAESVGLNLANWTSNPCQHSP